VITASLPEREEFRRVSQESVRRAANASGIRFEHVTVIDHDREGPQTVTNRAASMAKGDWVLPLADDDWLHDDFFQVLTPYMDSADVVSGWCHTTTDEWCPNMLFNERVLRLRNFLPATALIRKSLWDQLGGYRDCGLEDWDFWKRALDVGARFAHVPEVVWTFRIHDSNTYTLREKDGNRG